MPLFSKPIKKPSETVEIIAVEIARNVRLGLPQPQAGARVRDVIELKHRQDRLLLLRVDLGAFRRDVVLQSQATLSEKTCKSH